MYKRIELCADAFQDGFLSLAFFLFIQPLPQNQRIVYHLFDSRNWKQNFTLHSGFPSPFSVRTKAKQLMNWLIAIIHRFDAVCSTYVLAILFFFFFFFHFICAISYILFKYLKVLIFLHPIETESYWCVRKRKRDRNDRRRERKEWWVFGENERGHEKSHLQTPCFYMFLHRFNLTLFIKLFDWQLVAKQNDRHWKQQQQQLQCSAFSL